MSDRSIFGIGIGIAIIGLAYAYVTTKKTIEEGIGQISTLGGIIPTPADLARTGGQATGYVVDAAGNAVQGASYLGNLWTSGVGMLWQTVFPGDIPTAPGPGSGLPAYSDYTGPTYAENDLDYYIRTGVMRQGITTDHDRVILTVGNAWRGLTWTDADWQIMTNYVQSSLYDQDPQLREKATLALQQQEAIATRQFEETGRL